MANGPQHYRMAEEILDQAKKFMAENIVETRDEDLRLLYDQHAAMVAQANAHATLALAAASAQNIRRIGALDMDARGDWTQVLG